MTVAERLRKARACVIVTEAELLDLRNFFLERHATCAAEARTVSTMKRQLTAMSLRLENMAKYFDTGQ